LEFSLEARPSQSTGFAGFSPDDIIWLCRTASPMAIPQTMSLRNLRVHSIAHAQYLRRLNAGAISKGLIGHPTTWKALLSLSRQYDISNPVEVVREIAAYMAARDQAYIGLRYREAGMVFHLLTVSQRLPD
jgi:hypothetical protein